MHLKSKCHRQISNFSPNTIDMVLFFFIIVIFSFDLNSLLILLDWIDSFFVFFIKFLFFFFSFSSFFALLAGAVEYTDWTSAEG